MENRFSPEQIKELNKAAKKHRVPYIREKAKALLAVSKGIERKTVALVFGVSLHSLGKWIRRFFSEGIQGLIVKQGRGRKPRADILEIRAFFGEHKRTCAAVSDQRPLKACEKVTLNELREYIPSMRDMSVSGVWRTLKRAGIDRRTDR